MLTFCGSMVFGLRTTIGKEKSTNVQSLFVLPERASRGAHGGLVVRITL